MKYIAIKTVLSAVRINSSPFVILLIALVVNGFGQAISLHVSGFKTIAEKD